MPKKTSAKCFVYYKIFRVKIFGTENWARYLKDISKILKVHFSTLIINTIFDHTNIYRRPVGDYFVTLLSYLGISRRAWQSPGSGSGSRPAGSSFPWTWCSQGDIYTYSNCGYLLLNTDPDPTIWRRKRWIRILGMKFCCWLKCWMLKHLLNHINKRLFLYFIYTIVKNKQ